MTIFLCVVLILVLCGAVYLYRKQSQRQRQLQEEKDQLESKYGDLQQLSQSCEEASRSFQQMSEAVTSATSSLANYNSLINDAHHEYEVAIEKRNSAVALAEKDLALEAEKRRAEFENQLNKEFDDIRANHPATKYRLVLDELNLKIEEARKTLQIQQQQALQKQQQEDFFATHSVNLTDSEKSDIQKIMEFAPQLSRIEAFYKLIWTEYYQKPLQKLCKELGAEKVTGIYKITAQDGRCYIGQSLDIAARWKEHMKCALGIGSSSYQSNKFYRAMHKEGPENFTFEVLEICSRDKLDERERYWIEFYNAITFGFNSKVGG